MHVAQTREMHLNGVKEFMILHFLRFGPASIKLDLHFLFLIKRIIKARPSQDPFMKLHFV